MFSCFPDIHGPVGGVGDTSLHFRLHNDVPVRVAARFGFQGFFRTYTNSTIFEVNWSNVNLRGRVFKFLRSTLDLESLGRTERGTRPLTSPRDLDVLERRHWAAILSLMGLSDACSLRRNFGNKMAAPMVLHECLLFSVSRPLTSPNRLNVVDPHTVQK